MLDESNPNNEPGQRNILGLTWSLGYLATTKAVKVTVTGYLWQHGVPHLSNPDVVRMIAYDYYGRTIAGKDRIKSILATDTGTGSGVVSCEQINDKVLPRPETDHSSEETAA